MIVINHMQRIWTSIILWCNNWSQDIHTVSIYGRFDRLQYYRVFFKSFNLRICDNRLNYCIWMKFFNSVCVFELKPNCFIENKLHSHAYVAARNCNCSYRRTCCFVLAKMNQCLNWISTISVICFFHIFLTKTNLLYIIDSNF